MEYFGKAEAKMYGELIQKKESGRTISKRMDLVDFPGGLIWEAKNILNIGVIDLLRALEGMCYDGRAVEIDDSTYLVR